MMPSPVQPVPSSFVADAPTVQTDAVMDLVPVSVHRIVFRASYSDPLQAACGSQRQSLTRSGRFPFKRHLG